MIITDMKKYKVFGSSANSYGQTVPSSVSLGELTMAVYITDFDTQRNAAFSSSAYVGLTEDLTYVEDSNGTKYSLNIGHYVVGELDDQFNNKRLLQVNAIYHKGRYYQVFMSLTHYSVDEI